MITTIPQAPRKSRRQQLAERRAQRRVAMDRLRLYWQHMTAEGRAYLLIHRAQLWTYHTAAIAVERSAEARLAKLNGRIGR